MSSYPENTAVWYYDENEEKAEELSSYTNYPDAE